MLAYNVGEVLIRFVFLLANQNSPFLILLKITIITFTESKTSKMSVRLCFVIRQAAEVCFDVTGSWFTNY